jgi:hypothetical protein
MSDTYPVFLKGELTEPLSRWLWLVKWFLLIPHFIILIFLWIGFCISWIISLFVILFTGVYPRELFNYNVGVLRWTWRVGFYGYLALGTDQYPPFTIESVDYPADLRIPHYIVIAFFQGGGGPRNSGLIMVLAIFAGIVLLFKGSYPRDMFDLIMRMNRWSMRVGAYAAHMTDKYPPFRFD